MRKTRLDAAFQAAVAAIDAGDVDALERLLAAHPELARERLTAPGSWLRDQIGGALEDFFKAPYLLWFVAEDPKRNGTLPRNIAEIAGAIIRSAHARSVDSLQQQLDYALSLVCWSGVASDAGVQIALIDVLLDAGASPIGASDNALVNGHFAAAKHLVKKGAPLTLSTALCLGRLDEVPALMKVTSQRDLQTAFVLAALNGQADALQCMIDLGTDVNRSSQDLYNHATPLHHAVCSGSLESVRVLVDAGARLDVRDSAEQATPLGWAEYYAGENANDVRGAQFAQIADFLRMKQT
ncbi:MAG: ankyrin repeat domain-containing protein [Gemmatimonadota bacterium]